MNPEGEDIHEYTCPDIDGAPITVEEFVQIARSIPALAAGNGLTVTVTLLLLLHPVATIVSVKV